MAAPAQRRSGSLVQADESEAPKEPLFGTAVPGVGEVQSLSLPQVAPGSEAATGGHDPRDLALLVRPERYQERVVRQQKELNERGNEQQAEAQRQQQAAEALEARDAAVSEREAELEALVLEAVEARVEGLAEERALGQRSRVARCAEPLARCACSARRRRER